MSQLEREHLQRPERVHLGAFVDRDLAARLAELARAEDRSVSSEIRRAVTAHLERAEKTGRGAG
jgi:hypothetical protein